jgi:hypothetical protein
MESWLKSKDVKKELKITDCDLTHIRIAGILGFMKKGNTFMYNSKDILIYKLNKK